VQKKAVIGGAAAAVLVIGFGSWWAIDSSLESAASERGTCGSATWEIDTEPEDGGTEVSAELQSAASGESWAVSLDREDTVLLAGTRTTDEDGEIDLDAFSSSDAPATYTVTFTPADGESCTATVSS